MRFKKLSVFLILIILILAPSISAVSATTVFLTSDSIFGQQGEEVKMMNEIKNYIESDSNGDITVIVDSQSPAPGEGTRAMESDTDVSVNIAFADAANYYELARYSSQVSKQVIVVNVGSLDLNNLSNLRRAWDDNWSSESFLSIKNPGQFLSEAGISTIQPAQAYPDKTDSSGDIYYSDSQVNKYIADQIIKDANSYDSSGKTLNNDYVVRGQLNVSTIGDISQDILFAQQTGQLKDSYSSYTTPQALYLLSSYLAGSSLESPKEYKAPDNPQNYSTGTNSSYSIYDYEAMAEEVVNYMDEHNQAPDYIEYNGAKIGYADLLYNFATITSDDKDSSTMNLPATSEFKSFNNMDLLFYGIPILVAIGLILLFIGLRHRRR